MRPVIIAQCRAYLLVASLTAAAIQVLVLVTMRVFGVPETFFTSSVFRMAVLGLLVAAVVLTRRFADAAFRTAQAGNHLATGGEPHDIVTVSSRCPQRAWVVLHVRFSRRQLDPSRPDPDLRVPASQHGA
jgi:hypothetical protein